MKDFFDLDSLDKARLGTYFEVCSLYLARAHAWAGDAAFISGYISKNNAFFRAINNFAFAYAEQIESDI